MSTPYAVHSSEPTHHFTAVLLPGFTGDLAAPALSHVQRYLLQRGDCDVLEVPITYPSSAAAIETSQPTITETVRHIAARYPEKRVVLFAKSLSGALCLASASELPVSGIVVLGSSLVLGWPQRVHLLQENNAIIPDYRAEWEPLLLQSTVPTAIVSGDHDDLAANEFLHTVAARTPLLSVTMLADANHDLVNTQSGEVERIALERSIGQLLASLSSTATSESTH